MKSFFESNRNKLFEHMEIGEMAIFFAGEAPNSTADSHYPFRTDKNFYYVTGLQREGFIVVLEKKEKENKATLFIKEPNFDIEKWVGRFLSKEACTEISGIEDIMYIKQFPEWINAYLNLGTIQKVSLDLYKDKVKSTDTEAFSFSRTLVANYPYITIGNCYPVMSELRLIKSDYEITKIKEATELTRLGVEAIMKSLKPGDYEYMPAAEFAYTIRMNGADGNAFSTIAASGDNAVILHYEENEAKMKKGDLVLFDLGARYKEYAADISRTLPVSGTYSARQKEIYNMVLGAQKAVINMIKPGVTLKECNDICKEYLTEALINDGLIKEESELIKYYYHGVSHFLGLDVHDVGLRDKVFEPGMVLTVEPGLYIAEEGIGIRIEDNVLVTEEGAENLSQNIMKEIDDIEKFMA